MCDALTAPPRRPHGSPCVETGYWEGGKDYGEHLLGLGDSHIINSFVFFSLYQRRVEFPTKFDPLDLATDEVKAKLIPVSRKVRGNTQMGEK